jgi:CBS domain-containing protein
MSTPKRKLLVSNVMMPLDLVPVVRHDTIFKEALEQMGRKQMGIACIVSRKSKLLGILTDGDIRRMLLRVQKPFSAFFVDDALAHAIESPLTVGPDYTLAHAVELMDEKRIWDLPVITSDGTLVGLLHLHPAIEALLKIDE